jgi:branched-chain amino acid transport system substrate-binding protein
VLRRRWSSGSVALAILLATVGLSACDRDESGTGTVRIGVIAPLSGPLNASGLGIRNAVDLAVRQANEQGKLQGWKLTLAAEDDTAVPDVGANAATRLSDDRSVVAVVGTVNSSVAERAAPILDHRKVVMISPANTDPTLTRGKEPGSRVRPFQYYFRVAATDLAHGPFAANFAYQTGKRNVAVIHDKTTYGQGLALQFKAQLERLGGRVPTTETVDPEETDFSTVLSRVKKLNPDLIYFGGEHPAGSRLTSQAEQQGIKAPLMGGYGIFDPTYINLAREAAEGDFATAVSAATEQLPMARSFIDAYRAAGYADPYSAYGAYAYDAANVIIAALAEVLPDGGRISDDVRVRLRQAVQDGTIDGATGRVAFDRYGDRTTPVLTVYRVAKDAAGLLAWKPEETKEFH